MNVPMDEWLDLLRREYLSEFVPSGGSAVKIVVSSEAERQIVQERVADAAQSLGYVVARVDAGHTKVHMIDWIFHAVARQVDWDGLTARWLRDRMRENGILVEDDQPLHEMDAIARANGQFKPQLLGEINRLIQSGILTDHALSKEFRTAMAMLCLGQVNPENVSASDAELVKQWLLGDKCHLTALKRVGIYQHVGRQNARFLLTSLCAWLGKMGIPGLLLLLDISVVVADTPPSGNVIRYTRPGLLDTYEVLRQFIDDTDEVHNFILVVLSGPGITDIHNARRNVENYTALKMRIVEDVHDRSRANPLNILVAIEPAGSGGCPE